MQEKQDAARKGLLEFSTDTTSPSSSDCPSPPLSPSATSSESENVEGGASLSSSSTSTSTSSSRASSTSRLSGSSKTPSTAATSSVASLSDSTLHAQPTVAKSEPEREQQAECARDPAALAQSSIESAMAQDMRRLQLARDAEEAEVGEGGKEGVPEREEFVQVRSLDAAAAEQGAAGAHEGQQEAGSQEQAQAAHDAVSALVEELQQGEGQQHAGPVLPPSASEDSTGQEEEEQQQQQEFTGRPHLVLQASVTSITESHVIVQPARSGDPNFAELDGSLSSTSPSSSSQANASASHAAGNGSGGKKLWAIDSVSIPYSHLVYALGSHLPDPLRTEARTKADGMSWMKRIQARVRESHEIVLVGGGALGVEFATDIASVHPILRPGEPEGSTCEKTGERKKKVTLIHSRKQLLPNFDARVHEHALQRLNELGVHVVLGERLALTQGCPKGSTVSSVEDSTASTTVAATGATGDAKLLTDTAGHSISAPEHEHERKLIRTTGGKIFTADLLLLCTGQQPNSGLMAHLSPSSVDPKTRLVRVLPTLQVAVPDPRDAAQMPFDMRPPCGDCDCFLDRKTAGGAPSSTSKGSGGLEDSHEHRHHVEGLRNIYAIGDVADAFGAINAGYQAWSMADVAAENILRDIGASKPDPSEKPASSRRRRRQQRGQDGSNSESDGDSESLYSEQQLELQEFEPAPAMLKLSLGLGHMVYQGAPAKDESDGPDAIAKPAIGTREDPHDLGVEGVWKFMANAPTDDLYL